MEQPALLESVGSVALAMAASYFGTLDAVRFLLERGIREFYDCATGLYRKHQHEPVTKAFYHGNFETLRTVFEAGVSDASVISTSHVGWPANTSLLFWAVGRPVEFTEFALAYGADPEAPFSGNGEGGNTPLQEAAARFGTGGWNPDVADAVLALLGHGAHFDIFSACGMNDLERVLELAREDSSVVMQRGEMGMTPLHWASRSGSIPCVKWLLRHGAEVDAKTTTDRTPLHLAAERGRSRGGLASGRARRRSRRAGQKGAHAAPPGRVRRQARGGRGAHRPGSGQAAEDEVRQEAAAGGAAGLPAPEGGVKPGPVVLASAGALWARLLQTADEAEDGEILRALQQSSVGRHPRSRRD